MAPEQYQGLVLDLASRGYVVVGVDHAYEGRGQTVDGRALRPDPERRRPVMGSTGFDSAFMDFYRFRVRERVADFKSVSMALPSVLQWIVGRQTEPIFVENVAVVGHSIGGVAAFEACRTDATFAACVNLDGWALRHPFFSTANPERPSPVMYLGKPLSREPAPESETQRTEMLVREQALRARADSLLTIGGHPHYWVTIWDASHDAFSDGPVRKPGVAAGPRSRHLDAVRSYVSGFLDRYLRGVESGLLSPSFRPDFQASLERR